MREAPSGTGPLSQASPAFQSRRWDEVPLPREQSQVSEPGRGREHARELGRARVRLRATGGDRLVLPVSAPMKSRDVHVPTIQTHSAPRRHRLFRVKNQTVIPLERMRGCTGR